MAKLKGEKSDDNMIYIEDDDFWLVVWLVGWLVGWSTSLGVAWRELPPTHPLFQTMIKRVIQGSKTYAVILIRMLMRHTMPLNKVFIRKMLIAYRWISLFHCK